MTKARGCAVTLGSRAQLRNPLDISKNGREPKKGTLGGPGGRSLFLLNIFLIEKRMMRKRIRREASSIVVVVIRRSATATLYKCTFFSKLEAR